MSDSPGDVLTSARDNALKTVAIGAGILVYLGMIAYSGVHNWRLLTAGVAPGMVMWAGLGVVALEISAVFLPIALHWWTHSALQRMFAFAFYALDLLLVTCNVILDYAVFTGSGGDLPSWLLAYRFYMLPATPVICGLGWSILFLLDPSQKERAMVETLRSATRESLMGRIAQQARAADLTKDVDKAAAIMARDIISDTLGISLARTSNRKVVDLKASDPASSGNGKVVYNVETDGQGNPTEGVRK